MMKMIGRCNEDADDGNAYLASFDNVDVAWSEDVPAISDVAWSTLIPAWWIDECLECREKERTTEWV
jgi:hypothetical protein